MATQFDVARSQLESQRQQLLAQQASIATSEKRIPYTSRQERIQREQYVGEINKALKELEEAKQQVSQQEEQVKINSPEFQEGAYNEAMRIFSSGWGTAGLPKDGSPFSRAVKSYYYQIEKGMPYTYSEQTGTMVPDYLTGGGFITAPTPFEKDRWKGTGYTGYVLDSKGNIVGFDTGKTTVPIQYMSPSELSKLQNAGLINVPAGQQFGVIPEFPKEEKIYLQPRNQGDYEFLHPKPIQKRNILDILSTGYNISEAEWELSRDYLKQKIYDPLTSGMRQYKEIMRLYKETPSYKLEKSAAELRYGGEVSSETPLTFWLLGLGGASSTKAGAGALKAASTLASTGLKLGRIQLFPSPVQHPIKAITTATGLYFSKPISEAFEKQEQKWFGEKTDLGTQAAKGVTWSLAYDILPVVSTAMQFEIGKQVAWNPYTAGRNLMTGFVKEPLAYGVAALSGALYAKKIAPKIEETKYKILGKEEIGKKEATYRLGKEGESWFDVYSKGKGKYGKIILVYGKRAQSFEVPLAKQIKADIAAIKERIVKSHIAGEPIITPKVIVDRGLYQAPESVILKAFKDEFGPNASVVLTYYSGIERIRRMEEVSFNMFGEKAKPSLLLARSTSVPMKEWVMKTSDMIYKKQKIPSIYRDIVDKWYNRFLNDPMPIKDMFGNTIDYITGKEKLVRLQKIELRGMGSGFKLKYWAAIKQFAKENRIELPGGPEELSGILPFGPEEQRLVPIGETISKRSKEDLRKLQKRTFTEKLFGITGEQYLVAKYSPHGKIADFLLGKKIEEVKPSEGFKRPKPEYRLYKETPTIRRKLFDIFLAPTTVVGVEYARLYPRYVFPKTLEFKPVKERKDIDKLLYNKKKLKGEEIIRERLEIGRRKETLPRIERRIEREEFRLIRREERQRPRIEEPRLREERRRERIFELRIRPEPRRPERPRPERPRPEEPRRPERPRFELFRERPKESRKREELLARKRKKQQPRKFEEYLLEPTATGVAFGITPKKRAKLGALTGFELLR